MKTRSRTNRKRISDIMRQRDAECQHQLGEIKVWEDSEGSEHKTKKCQKCGINFDAYDVFGKEVK